MSQKLFNWGTWIVWGILLGCAVVAWGQGINWRIDRISIYQWFPLFGMVAWLTMAMHYYNGSLRLSGKLERPPYFKQISEYVVLTSLLLHPGLLAYQLVHDGYGLPPGSFLSFVGEAMAGAVLLGLVSLLLFLSFEVLNRIRRSESLQKRWWIISASQVLAMLLVWVHALRLGSSTGAGWFQALWLAAGVLLLPCFYVIIKADLSPQPEE